MEKVNLLTNKTEISPEISADVTDQVALLEDVEEEDLYSPGAGPVIVKPYNTKFVDITSDTLSMSNLIDRFKYNEIELQPDYQRKGGLWSYSQKSRLIESILISIPLPFFYFDVRNDEKWEVVDGLQRLTSLREFIYDKTLVLCDLEYLTELNGKKFDELPRTYQRKLNESNFSTYLIREGTPDDVMMNIFRRINTGGIPLMPGEIRNACFRGAASNLVKALAECESFKIATRNKIKIDRMEDRDLVTRFLAFYLQSYTDYLGNMDLFLDSVLSSIKKKSNENIWNKIDSENVLKAFDKSMKLCIELFGELSFRKMQKNKDGTLAWRYGKINKSMFECVSASFAQLSEEKQNKLIQNKKNFAERFPLIFEGDFYSSVNSATGTIEHVRGRYESLNSFIEQFLEEKC